jgi:hypothetical protein
VLNPEQIWQVDFYRRPLQDEQGRALWELVICDPAATFQYIASCPQSQVSAEWLLAQLQQVATSHALSAKVQAFRPQSLALLEVAATQLNIAVEATRRTPTLKRLLLERSRQYPSLLNYTGQPFNPLDLDKPPPVPLPENLWGDRWRFATLPAADVVDVFSGRMIPILNMPENLLPLNLGLASTTAIPGVVIDGGRQALRLAQWIEQARPVSLHFVAGAPDGLILEAGLVDRWIVATFEDLEVATAARNFEQRKQTSQGLHFLLVQPDDSGMTYSGFWLLKLEN